MIILPSVNSGTVASSVSVGIPVASKEILTVDGNFFYKRNTFNEFLGNCAGGGDVAYMGNGLIYANIIDDNIYMMIVAPNANVLDNPDPGGNWISPESNWIPTLAGVIDLSIRLYTPMKKFRDGNWSPPVIQKIS
jgi:hypothetical protein